MGIKTIPMPAHDAAEIETPIRVGSGGECQPPVSPGGEGQADLFLGTLPYNAHSNSERLATISNGPTRARDSENESLTPTCK